MASSVVGGWALSASRVANHGEATVMTPCQTNVPAVAKKKGRKKSGPEICNAM